MRVPVRVRFPALILGALSFTFSVGAISRAAHAQSSSSGLSESPIGPAGGGGLPATTIAPADENAQPPPPSAAEPPAAPPSGAEPETPEAAPGEAPAEGVTAQHHAVRHVVHKSRATAAAVTVNAEPVKGRLKLKEDSWVYAEPSNRSAQLEPAPVGNFVDVTGITHYYLRVKLQKGGVGYVPIDAVDVVLPTDRYFVLTHDASVVDAPSRYGKKVSEVHKGHAVHVTGVALNCVQIRMHSGLVGFIPASALE